MPGDKKSLGSFHFNDNESTNLIDTHILQSYNSVLDDTETIMLIDQPQHLADTVYEAICKDIEEKPNPKGMTAFRDRVFEDCSPKAIVLRDVRMSTSGIAALTRMMNNMNVSTLDLSHNNLGDEGVNTLVNCIANRPIVRYLNLSSNEIGYAGCEALVTILPYLKTLNLSNLPGVSTRNHIYNNACVVLFQALRTNTTLTSLDLSNNTIGISNANTTTQEHSKFSIASTNLFDLISSILLTSSLHRLNLDKCHLGSRGATSILSALSQNKTLKFLSLAGNNLGSDIAAALEVLLLNNSTLAILRLRNNPIGQGITRICQALSQNRSLTVLDLSNCDIDDYGA